jgi:FKBP-type peptidyl-prolyl cis-trans isomerase
MKLKLPLIAAFVAVLGLTACGGGGYGDSGTTAPTVAVSGTYANVKYTGWVYDAAAPNTKGKQFDTGQFEFRLGSGAVIVGFDKGVNGMKVGEKKTVRIAANEAYGANPPASSGIPANADLVFDIELVSLR